MRRGFRSAKQKPRAFRRGVFGSFDRGFRLLPNEPHSRAWKDGNKEYEKENGRGERNRQARGARLEACGDGGLRVVVALRHGVEKNTAVQDVSTVTWRTIRRCPAYLRTLRCARRSSFRQAISHCRAPRAVAAARCRLPSRQAG